MTGMPYQRVSLPRMKVGVAKVCVVSCFFAVLGRATVATAAEPMSYVVRARVVTRDAHVRGTAHVQVQVAEGERELRFWLLADRVAVRPSVLDQINARWLFPGEVDLGGMDVGTITLNGQRSEGRLENHPAGSARGRDFSGSDLVVPIAPGPARVVDVEIDFTIRVPNRFGRLGAVDDRLTLTAPWYPLLVGTSDAWRYRVPHRIVIAADEACDLLIGGEVVRPAEEHTVLGAFAPVLVAPSLQRWQRVAGGRSFDVVAPYRLYRPSRDDAEGLERLEDVLAIDRIALIERAVEDAVRTLRRLHLAEYSRTPLTVAFVPSRTELAASAPGVVLVSDRIFEIFPIDLTREFQLRGLRRAFFRAMLAPLVDEVEAPVDRSWSEDLRAAFLTDVDLARRHGEAQTPRELIGFAAFHPSVDQLLYAPQIAFVGAYFGTVSDLDPYRDSPDAARRPVASGRRILESARDALTPDAFERFSEALASRETTIRDALEAADPHVAERLGGWLSSASREVNYRLGTIRSDRLVDGGYRHRVEVLREGDPGREPVEVRFEDTDGGSAVVVWDSEGPRGEVTWESEAELDDVEIDPRGRLVQSARVADGHPRGDDATSHPFRPPLLRAFGLNVLVSEGQVTGFADFALRRRYDLEHTWATLLRVSTAAYSGSIRYIQGVGPKRTTNARIGFLSGGLGVARLRSDFAEEVEGGWRLSAFGSAGFDTRFYRQDPRSGESLVASGRLGPVFRDDGGVRLSGALGLRGSYTLGLGLKNALVFVGNIGWTFGEALPGENQALGGRFALRGFETTELVGRVGAFGVVEHRWTAVSDLEWNLLHLAWLRELQLAAFVGGGVMMNSIRDGATVGAAEIGVGLRLHFEYGGVQPGVFAVDVALPLTRGQNTVGSDGVRGADRLPLGLHASFDQYF